MSSTTLHDGDQPSHALDATEGSVAEAAQESALPDELWEIGEIELLSERTTALLGVLERLSAEELHLPALVGIWNAARRDDPIGLRLLCSLLEVRQSGLELLKAMIRPSQAVRLCLFEARRRAAAVRPQARRAATCMAQVGVTQQDVHSEPGVALQRLYREAQECLDLLLAGDLPSTRLRWLRDLVETELQARATRLEALAERVGAYDGGRIARVLPHLTRQEEAIRDTRELMVQWPETDELRRRTPVLEAFLERRSYERLVRALQGTPGGHELALLFVLLSRRVPVTRDLLFVAAVLRQLASPEPRREGEGLDPARSLLVALRCMRQDGSIHLRLEPADLRRNRGLLRRIDASEIRPGVVVLAYDERRHHALLQAYATPALQPTQRPLPADIREIVLDNLQNEHILSGLLGNPRVLAAPGLVETVVHRSRSIKILLDIANRRELHSGHANRNVPRTLLEHPSSIPLSALRKFVHVRYVERGVLQVMANRGSRVRPEVRSMAKQYLASIGSGTAA